MVRLWKALLNTLAGLRWGIRYEAALREEFVALLVGIPLSVFLAPTIGWWLALIGALTVLVIVELLNTAIEKLSDHVTPEHHQAIKVVKDLGSAAVFFALVLAILTWGCAVLVRVQ